MNIAVIFAGGKGTRMKSEIPKQLIKICDKEVIAHVIQIFENSNLIDSIYIAFIEDRIDELKEIIKKYQFKKPITIVAGGNSGQESIYYALKKASEENSKDSIVYIHDGVRPFITEETIQKNYEMVLKKGNSITGTPATETIAVTDNDNTIENIYDRSKCFTAQAPQCFYLKDILKAHELEIKANNNYQNVIDSSTLMKKHFPDIKLNVIKGDEENIKITNQNDLIVAEAYFQKSNKFRRG